MGAHIIAGFILYVMRSKKSGLVPGAGTFFAGGFGGGGGAGGGGAPGAGAFFLGGRGGGGGAFALELAGFGGGGGAAGGGLLPKLAGLLFRLAGFLGSGGGGGGGGAAAFFGLFACAAVPLGSCVAGPLGCLLASCGALGERMTGFLPGGGGGGGGALLASARCGPAALGAAAGGFGAAVARLPPPILAARRLAAVLRRPGAGPAALWLPDAVADDRSGSEHASSRITMRLPASCAVSCSVRASSRPLDSAFNVSCISPCNAQSCSIRTSIVKSILTIIKATKAPNKHPKADSLHQTHCTRDHAIEAEKTCLHSDRCLAYSIQLIGQEPSSVLEPVR